MSANGLLVALCGGMDNVKRERLTEMGLVAGDGVAADTSNGKDVCVELSVLEVHASRAPLPQRVDRSPPQRHGPVACGLDKAIIAQLPTFIYRAQETTGKGPNIIREKNKALLDCAICLSEFLDNEKGRWLPSCKHVFHIECIDMWFCSHSTCPLCRTDVVLIKGDVVLIKGDEQIPQTPMEASTGSSQQYNGPVDVQNEPRLDVSRSPVIDIFNCNQIQVVARSSSAKDPS
ncbi:hypothetical protein L7F22_048598 [Adiantum nelumboides]|nr:hypothetical protein [Adiantum nelumboides]